MEIINNSSSISLSNKYAKWLKTIIRTACSCQEVSPPKKVEIVEVSFQMCLDSENNISYEKNAVIVFDDTKCYMLNEKSCLSQYFDYESRSGKSKCDYNKNMLCGLIHRNLSSPFLTAMV